MSHFDYKSPEQIKAFIYAALREDIGSGDHSSLASISVEAESRARLLIKDEGILAGVEMAQHIINAYDPQVKMEVLIKDGQAIVRGDVAFHLMGKARSILTIERLILNCMQRMSGIATLTHQLKACIEGTKAQLLDTRKTTPNFRLAEKWAVLIGGGMNHRFGLFDMIMLKDNHVDFAGGITKAVEATNAYLKSNNLELDIIVEVRNLAELKELLATSGVRRVLLDNMGPNLLKEAIALINGQIETEASGGITQDTILEIAKTGIDYISVGALTHSAKSLDMSLKAF